MPFSPIAGVIFDFDGTLADTLPLCFAAFAHAFERFTGERWSNARISRLFGPSEEGIFRTVRPNDWEAALEEYLTFYAREHAHLGQTIPGVAELLDWLGEREIPVGVVTGKGQQSAEISLRALGLAGRIGTARYGSPLGGVKPYAIRDILDEWRLPAERVAYVGDAASDMHDAACAGVLPVGAAWAPDSNATALRAAGAVYVFSAPAELQTWLSGGAPEHHRLIELGSFTK